MEPAAQAEDHTSLEVVSGSGQAIQLGMAATVVCILVAPYHTHGQCVEH